MVSMDHEQKHGSKFSTIATDTGLVATLAESTLLQPCDRDYPACPPIDESLLPSSRVLERMLGFDRASHRAQHHSAVGERLRVYRFSHSRQGVALGFIGGVRPFWRVVFGDSSGVFFLKREDRRGPVASGSTTYKSISGHQPSGGLRP